MPDDIINPYADETFEEAGDDIINPYAEDRGGILGAIQPQKGEPRAEEEGPGILEKAVGAIPQIAAETYAGAKAAGRRTPVGMAASGLAAGGVEAVQILGEEAEAATGLDVPFVEGAEAPTTSREAAGRIGKAAAEGAVGEGLSRGVIALGGKVLRGFSKTRTPEADRAIKFMDDKLEQPLLPSEATENRALDIMDNIAEGSLFGGGKISRFKADRAKLMEEAADDIIDQFGARAQPDVTGDLFVKVLNHRIKPSRALSKTLYNKLDDMVKPTMTSKPVSDMVDTGLVDGAGKAIMRPVAGVTEVPVGGVKIPLKSAKKFVEPFLKDIEELGGLEAANAGDNLVKIISGMDDSVDFTVAKELRSRLISVADELAISNPKAQAIGKSKQLVNLIDDAMGKTLKAENPEAYAVWREANKVYKEGSKIFRNKFMKRLVKMAEDNPHQVAPAIFKPRNIKSIVRAKEAMGGVDTPAWKNLQSAYTQDLMAKATPKGKGVQGADLEHALFGKAGMGEKALKEIYTPKQLSTLKEFTNALKVTQQGKEAEGIGRMAIQFTQIGALTQITRAPGKAVAILASPLFLSHAFTNPKIAKWLIHGMKAPAGSRVAADAFTKMASELAEMGEKVVINPIQGGWKKYLKKGEEGEGEYGVDRNIGSAL